MQTELSYIRPTNSTQRRRMLARLGQTTDVADTATVLVTETVGKLVEEVVHQGPKGLLTWYLNRDIVQEYGPYAAPIIAIITSVSLAQTTQFVSVLSKIGKLIRGQPQNNNVNLPPTPQAGKISEDKPDSYSFDAKMSLTSVILICLGDRRSVLNCTADTVDECNKLRYRGIIGRSGNCGNEHLYSSYGNFRKYGMYLFLLTTLKKIAQILWSKYSSPIGACYTTRFITKTLSAGALSSSQQRQVFVDLPLVKSKPVGNHTHGTSASDRNAGSATCALAAVSLGLEPYFIQQSLSDVRKQRKGDRSFHWPKDVAIPPSEFRLDAETQAGILIDVDYYIDMPLLLARYPGTYLISAFQPTAVAKSTGEYTFRFLQDGRVKYEVSGGATYEHLVWDYSGDTFLVEDVGVFTKTVCSYHIDRKFVDDHHCIILLSLIGKFDAPSIIPTATLLQGKALTRLSPVADGHCVMDIVKPEGRYRSVAIIGDHTAVTLPKAQFDAVRSVALIAKQTVTASTVASNISPTSLSGMPTERLPPGHAAILTSYLRSVIPHSPPVVFPPSEALITIRFGKNDYDAPVPLSAFGSPLIGPCYAYANSIAGDDACIKGRVEKFQYKKEADHEPPIPPTLAGYMQEFAIRLIPEAQVGDPVDEDYVMEKMHRSNQQHLLRQGSVTGDNVTPKFSCFIKKETAVKPSDPRNISSGEPSINLEYAKFIYAFHNEVMKKQEWYAFGKTPKECAERVVEILKEAAHSVCADATRFDAHVKRYARILERICMLRFFRRQYHSRVNEMSDAQIGIPGITTEGRKYWSGYSRGSGSMETSDFNSIITAFIDYCGWRNTTIDGIKCSPDLAWSKLGIYGGDDSLAGAVDPAALERSAKLMGQDYEITVVLRGELGVEFLNRQFGPDVWTGDASSMANPRRLLSKLWTGPTQLHDPLTRFAERCSGYYRMDSHSPVVGDIVTVAHVLLGDYKEGRLMPWDGRVERSSNWPNEDSGWMNDCFNKFIPDFDHDRFNTWITEVHAGGDGRQLLRAPLCTPQNLHDEKPKLACIVGDNLYQETEKPRENTTAASSTNPEEVAELYPLSDPNGVDDTPRQSTDYISSSSELEFKNSVGVTKDLPDMVIEADAVIPTIGTEGKRVKKGKGKAKQPQKQAGNLKHDKPATTDPRQWAQPKQGKQETKEVFVVRVEKWNTTRAAVAKRMGIKL